MCWKRCSPWPLYALSYATSRDETPVLLYVSSKALVRLVQGSIFNVASMSTAVMDNPAAAFMLNNLHGRAPAGTVQDPLASTVLAVAHRGSPSPVPASYPAATGALQLVIICTAHSTRSLHLCLLGPIMLPVCVATGSANKVTCIPPCLWIEHVTVGHTYKLAPLCLADDTMASMAADMLCNSRGRCTMQ